MSKQSDIVKVSQGASGDPLYIDTANNRVGVGTSLPAASLDVVTGVDDRLLITNLSGDTLLSSVNAANTAYNGLAINGSEVKLWTNATERVRIDGAGRFLKGTTTQVHHGKTFETVFNASVNANMGIRNPGAGAYNAIVFMNDNGQVGYINTEPNAVTYATSSDYRLKEAVQPLTGASDRVLALNPVNFAWKTDGSRVDGFLAHEAQEVVPEAVHGTKDEVDEDGNPVYQGIDQSKLVPLLTAALQEALTEITALKDRVAALEAV